jgi:hypothetical protein
MKLSEYWMIVEEWRVQFKQPSKLTIKPYNPVKQKLACRKCGKIKQKVNRHHKANDFFFAIFLPEVYAERYIEFRAKDIDTLCRRCHRNWHKYLQPKIKKMYDELESAKALPFSKKKEWADNWRNKCLQWYEKWVVKPIRRKAK